MKYPCALQRAISTRILATELCFKLSTAQRSVLLYAKDMVTLRSARKQAQRISYDSPQRSDGFTILVGRADYVTVDPTNAFWITRGTSRESGSQKPAFSSHPVGINDETVVGIDWDIDTFATHRLLVTAKPSFSFKLSY
jgi:hypothetical protein